MQEAEEGRNHILGKLSSQASVQVLEHHGHWWARDHETPFRASSLGTSALVVNWAGSSCTVAQNRVKHHGALQGLASRRDQHFLVYEFPPFCVFPGTSKSLCAQESSAAALPYCGWLCQRGSRLLGTSVSPRLESCSWSSCWSLWSGVGLEPVNLSPITGPGGGSCWSSALARSLPG